MTTKPIFSVVSLLLAVVFLLSACQLAPLPPPVAEPTIAAVPAEKPAAAQPGGLRFDAPEYAIDGPYAVGVRHFHIQAAKDNERPLNLTVWYPALNPNGIDAAITYEMTVDPGITPPWGVQGHALRDAAPDVSGGPYPLVIYSHGHTSFSQDFAYFVEHLTSHGFVVLAVDHQDNPTTTFGQKAWQTEYQRPDEVRRQIVFADSLTAANGPLAGMIDTERVGVAGFSLGGGTALATGGARLDLDNFRSLCESGSPEIETWPLAADCVNVLDNEEELAALAGLDEVPQGLWPDWSDERVDAVVALGPAVVMFGNAGIQSIDTPTMLMIGSVDFIAGPLYEKYSPYQNLEVGRKVEVVFDSGGHMLFFPACRDAPDLVDLGLEFYCSDPVWDMDRAHDLINHFATAFLLAELKGGAEAAAALAADQVSFPGIEYRAEGYGPAAGLDDETIATVESLVEEAMAAHGIPGVALSIVKGDTVVYSRGFGLAEYGTDRAMTPQTVFPMASNSKEFTTAAIMQLVAAGGVDLDAPVIAYLPYFRLADGRQDEITVRHLLGNYSGMPDLPEEKRDYTRRETSPEALEAFVRSLADTKLAAEPGGDFFIYANPNFDIAGAIVAAVSGEPFEEYVQNHIFAPLGMEHSTFLMTETDPAQRTAAHWRDDNGQMVAVPEPPDYDQVHTPSGGLLSTLDDMTLWALANLNRGQLGGQRFLPESAYEEMWKPHVAFNWGMGAPFDDWGLGWALTEIDGYPIVFWGGLHVGVTTSVYVAPEDDIALVALVNFSEDASISPPWYTIDIGLPALLRVLAGEEGSAAATNLSEKAIRMASSGSGSRKMGASDNHVNRVTPQAQR